MGIESLAGPSFSESARIVAPMGHFGAAVNCCVRCVYCAFDYYLAARANANLLKRFPDLIPIELVWILSVGQDNLRSLIAGEGAASPANEPLRSQSMPHIGKLEVSRQGYGAMGLSHVYGQAEDSASIATIHRAI